MCFYILNKNISKCPISPGILCFLNKNPLNNKNIRPLFYNIWLYNRIANIYNKFKNTNSHYKFYIKKTRNFKLNLNNIYN